ncbi:hypothetical protein [Runella zeae]|uniref:hypothetical protein n=1 Tax=Runella zeae TaxID=94255 RepID=UPI0012F91382|nr:hypothetical protein [Runella zeae]
MRRRRCAVAVPKHSSGRGLACPKLCFGAKFGLASLTLLLYYASETLYRSRPETEFGTRLDSSGQGSVYLSTKNVSFHAPLSWPIW